MQAQIQVLIANRIDEEIAVAISRLNPGSNIEVAKLQMFNGEVSKVLEFLIAYKIYVRIRMRETVVEEYIQWILLYV